MLVQRERIWIVSPYSWVLKDIVPERLTPEVGFRFPHFRRLKVAVMGIPAVTAQVSGARVGFHVTADRFRFEAAVPVFGIAHLERGNEHRAGFDRIPVFAVLLAFERSGRINYAMPRRL